MPDPLHWVALAIAAGSASLVCAIVWAITRLGNKDDRRRAADKPTNEPTPTPTVRPEDRTPIVRPFLRVHRSEPGSDDFTEGT